MLIADCGTVWTKIIDMQTGSVEIVRSQELAGRNESSFEWATGHLGKKFARNYENELVVLSVGALPIVSDKDFTIVDVGGRDIKYCIFKDRKLARMDWNRSCGATTGFILDLLAVYYKIDYNTLPAAEEPLDATCGIFGIEKVFDKIVAGASAMDAVSGMVLGVAGNIYNFLEKPGSLYLSGGLCENKCFTESLGRYLTVKPLGRFVLTEGLKILSRDKKNKKTKTRERTTI